MRTILSGLLLASALVGGACKSNNNSADTDKAAHDVRKAQDDVNSNRKTVADQAGAVADQQAKLDHDGRQLGSAQATLALARSTYGTAVQDRLVKLDDKLAKLAAKTDAKSKDAATGIQARRDQLGSKLAAMPSTPDLGWTAYTKDIDTTFDAIEKDLGNAG